MIYFNSYKYFFAVSFLFMNSFISFGVNANATKPWTSLSIPAKISKNVLFLPISHADVKSIPIADNGEELVDLIIINNSRIRPLSSIEPKLVNTYDGYSKIRLGVYNKLLEMLEILPKDIGIAYYEGFRPLSKQKEYFDKKFKENLVIIKDKNLAYLETCKSVSPFIDNVPTHATGAAIDITLFRIKEDGKIELIDMGKFDTIWGPNDAEEAFSKNTTEEQKKNRIILFNAAAIVGLVSYGYEWWHFSYGDRMWAYVKKEKYALYGLAVDKYDPILKIKKEEYLKNF